MLREPVFFVRWVASRPRLSFGVALGVHLFFVALSIILILSGYDLYPVNFTGLPLELREKPWLKREKAWLNRDNYTNRVDRKLPSSKNRNWDRAFTKDWMLLFYHDNDGGNIFTKEKLRRIRDIETALVNAPNFDSYCQMTRYGTCYPFVSVLRFFDGTFAFLDPVFNDTEFDNVARVLFAAHTHNETKGAFTYALGKTNVVTKTLVSTTLTRTIIPLGWPLSAYGDDEQAMEDATTEFLLDGFKPIMDEFLEDPTFDFVYFNYPMMFEEVEVQNQYDMLLVFGSLVFIFCYILFHTGSLWVTCFAEFSIVCSFLETNVIYRMVIGFKYFGYFHVLAMFIILGIGADDLFVFWDSWTATSLRTYPSLAHRLYDAYRKSMISMFVTSITTMTAFLANAMSPLLATKSFGVFASVLVVIDYVAVITFIPTVVIFYHVHFEDKTCLCCCRKKTNHRSAEEKAEEERREAVKCVSQNNSTAALLQKERNGGSLVTSNTHSAEAAFCTNQSGYPYDRPTEPTSPKQNGCGNKCRREGEECYTNCIAETNSTAVLREADGGNEDGRPSYSQKNSVAAVFQGGHSIDDDEEEEVNTPSSTFISSESTGLETTGLNEDGQRSKGYKRSVAQAFEGSQTLLAKDAPSSRFIMGSNCRTALLEMDWKSYQKCSRRNGACNNNQPSAADTAHSGQNGFSADTAHSGQNAFSANTAHSGQNAFSADTAHSDQNAFSADTGHGGQNAFSADTGHGGQNAFSADTGRGGQNAFSADNGHSGQNAFSSDTGHGGQNAFSADRSSDVKSACTNGLGDSNFSDKAGDKAGEERGGEYGEMPVYSSPQNTSVLVTFFREDYFYAVTHKYFRWIMILLLLGCLSGFSYCASYLVPDNEQIKLYTSSHHYTKAVQFYDYGFVPNDVDLSATVYLVWGLKEASFENCHFSEYSCEGVYSYDDSFDISTEAAQRAILKFCETMHNFTETEVTEYAIKRDLLTGRLEIACFPLSMDAFFKRNAAASGNADVTIPWNWAQTSAFMTSHSKYYNVSAYNSSFTRFMDIPMTYWLWDGFNRSNTQDFQTFNKLIGEELGPHSTTILTDSEVTIGNRIKYMAISVNTTMRLSMGYEEGLPVVKKWEEFMQQQLKLMPPELQGGFQTSEHTWHWLHAQQVLAHNAILGMSVGLALAFPVLVVATCNIINGLLATLTICCVTVCVVGVIPFGGWKLGVLVSLNMSLVVGLAVDFVVHLAEAYHSSHYADRRDKLRHALERVGVSVFSGACTTLGASVFMLFAKIQFFFQFGVFMFSTIGFSLLFSLGLYVTLMGIVGPEGDVGDIRVLFRKCCPWWRDFRTSEMSNTCKASRSLYCPECNSRSATVTRQWVPSHEMEEVSRPGTWGLSTGRSPQRRRRYRTDEGYSVPPASY